MKDTPGTPEIPDIDPQVPPNAVRVYETDATDDFPVLKAFQQYINAEQAKSRKRVIVLCVFFVCLMAIVIGVFVALLINLSTRNQALNDRLIEYAMRKESAPTTAAAAPVVVQPPQDSAAILALTAKLDALQKKLAEDQAKAEQAAKEAAERAEKAAIEAAKPKGPTKEELEIKRLKALLLAEKEKSNAAAAAERERRRQEEIEEYRRKHYPELYTQPKRKPTTETKKPVKKSLPSAQKLKEQEEEVDREIEALSYFDDENDEVEKPAKPLPSEKPETEKKYSIPVEIRGSSTSWKIPND